MRAKKNEVRIVPSPYGFFFQVEYRKRGQWFWRLFAKESRYIGAVDLASRLTANFDHEIKRHESRDDPIYFEVKS